MNRKITVFTAISILVVLIAFLLDSYTLTILPFIRHSLLNPFFIFLGGKIGLLAYILLLSILLFSGKEKELIIYLIIAVVAAVALSYVLKYIVMRPRPDLLALMIKSTPSFPSTHALVASSAFFFIKKLNKNYKIIAFTLMVLVILTGFYNGIHYLSDVVTGVILGIMVSYLTLNNAPLLVKKLRKKS